MKIKVVVICMLMLVVSSAIVFGDSIGVSVEGKTLTFDVPPVLDNGRTLVPLRAIFEELGAEISWDAETKTITALREGTEVVLQIGNSIAKVDGADVVLDVPAKIVDGRTMVPVRFVSEAMGSVVGWDNNTKTVSIRAAKIMKHKMQYDQTWTKDEGPYIIEGVFSISKGRKVDVEAGTEIYLKKDELTVYGDFVLNGLDGENIYIYDQSPSKNARLMISGGNSKIEFVSTDISVECTKTPGLEISNSKFNEIDIRNSDNMSILNSSIVGGEYGISLHESDNVVVNGNTITNVVNGISLKMCKDSEVSLNDISNCEYGILSNTNYNSKVTMNNVSKSTKYGINIVNASYGNEYYHNNFFENTCNAKVDISENSINMFDNYWGVHKLELVDSTIEDNSDNRELPKINFDPILTEPYKK